MGFTVTRPNGTSDAEFETYSRLLRQRGVNLANVPRVPDPANPGRRWVAVWDTRDEAQRFADDLREESDDGWRVEATDAPPSNGPFGPVLIQLVRQSDALVFALHPLSRAMIRSALPGSTPAVTTAILDTPTWNDFVKNRGGLGELVEEIAPPLTGLTAEQLTDFGYAVIDADDYRAWVYVPPAGLVQVPA